MDLCRSSKMLETTTNLIVANSWSLKGHNQAMHWGFVTRLIIDCGRLKTKNCRHSSVLNFL